MLQFENGFNIFKKRQNLPRLTTGNADLDSLLGGGIEPSQFYLFYGDKESGVDILIHQILVNGLLPTNKFGLEGKCIYSNCGNYYEDRTMLDTQLLCFLVKAVGLEPVLALDEIYTICSFSEDQEEQIFDQIETLLQKDPSIRLVAVHNIARLFTMKTRTPNRNNGERILRLQKVIGRLQQLCAENSIAFVASCRPALKGYSYGIPKPEGGKYLSHKATTIVYLRKRQKYQVQACLIKHPNRKPRNINLQIRTGSELLGRITKSFRLMLQEEMSNLKRVFREALMDAGRRDAFDSLIVTWSSEQGAMSYARSPTALDIMLLTSEIDNRKLIEDLQDQLGIMMSKLELMDTRIGNLFD